MTVFASSGNVYIGQITRWDPVRLLNIDPGNSLGTDMRARYISIIYDNHVLGLCKLLIALDLLCDKAQDSLLILQSYVGSSLNNVKLYRPFVAKVFPIIGSAARTVLLDLLHEAESWLWVKHNFIALLTIEIQYFFLLHKERNLTNTGDKENVIVINYLLLSLFTSINERFKITKYKCF